MMTPIGFDTGSRGEVHVWLQSHDSLAADETIAAWRTCMSPEERATEARFVSLKDRSLYACSRAFMRNILSRYVAMNPSEWRFTKTALGKPEIQRVQNEANLRFNLSHTSGLVVLAVTVERRVGIDAENIRVRAGSAEAIASQLCALEIDGLRHLSSREKFDRLYELWTLKEAYAKARGMGLSLPFDRFGFDVSESAGSLWVGPTIQDASPGWCFWQFRPSAGRIAALCVECKGDEGVALKVYQLANGDAALINPAVVRAFDSRPMSLSSAGR